MNAISWVALIGLTLLLFYIFFRIKPSIYHSKLARARQRLMLQLESRRGSRVILMIERQKIISFFGIPRSRSLDIEDPADVLRSIRLTLPNVPIDLIVHTMGGLGPAVDPIAEALVRHNAPVTLMVPYYAMSGGTRLALASDKILMSRSAVLGPEACQPGTQPAFGVLESLAEVLGEGCWTHTAPLTFGIARKLGILVSDDLPDEAYQLVDLYPRASERPPSLQPVPMLSGSDDAHMPESEKA